MRRGKVLLLGCALASLIKSSLQAALKIGQSLFGFFECEVTASHESLDITHTHVAKIADGAIHQWLRIAGIVALIVAVAAITHHVDHHVFMEPLTVRKGESCHSHTCLWVITIDVNDGSLNGFRNIGAVLG